MKVMLVNSLYYPDIIGGAEKSTQIIAENLKKSGIDTVVVTVSDTDRIDYINGVKVYYVYHSNVYWSYYSKTKKSFLKVFWHLVSLYNFSILRRVDAIIKIEAPDIVNTNNLSEFSAGIWKVIKKNKIPLVHTLRDYSLICPRATLFKGKDICRKKNQVCILIMNFKRFFTKYVDAVVGNSHFILNEHIKSGFFKSSEKHVVYNSLETEKISSRAKTPVEKIKFGYTGHLSYHKGIEFLLNVFKEASIADLHVFGRGITPEYEEYLRSKYKSERITFHGFQKTEEAFNLIDVLIVPSLWHDTLPRVIYEAYSYGVPVIGSDRGGIPEIIDIGKTGFVYSAESENELLEKIKIFVGNPGIINNMTPYCLKKAEDFLPEKVLQKYVNIYENTIKKIYGHDTCEASDFPE
ncbi:MAG: glycosyltransferase family 4 protein [Actinomycetota bacterium]|nr:glycosyltransferase family 4 protein [Actinomycetota bacterium]